MLERHFNGLKHTRALDTAQAKTVGHHIQHPAWPGDGGHLALRLHLGKAADGQPLFNLLRRGAARQFHRKRNGQPRVPRAHALHQLGINGLGRIVPDRLRRVPVKQLARPRKQQLQVVVQLGHGAHGGTRRAHRVGLVDGDGRRHAIHPVHGRFVHAVQKLPCIGRESFHVAALALGIQGVKHQTRLARAAGTGHHRQLAGANVEVEVFEVVLACAANADETVWHGGVSFLWGPDILGSSPGRRVVQGHPEAADTRHLMHVVSTMIKMTDTG